ncbi:MAG: right-handed parallel beta-helix repeat-containing protein [Verrucomicrobia bacterium]|nr:right-handed parallel beta-helix repeat-containing protein [Verrucomicrobiota bacterium]
MNLVRLLFFFLFIQVLAPAEIHQVGPSDDWFGLLHGDGLQPGDEVVLLEGTYSNPRMLVLSHVGTSANPIVIRAAVGAKVIFRRPDDRQNTFNLSGTQYITLKGFEITGGAAAIRIYKHGDTMAKFVTLEGLHIHHLGGVAVTCNHVGNLYEGMVFRRNHIHHTSGHGEAFYLGSNSESNGKTQTQFFHGLIEGNYIHDLKGPQVSQGDGIELKDGSWGNLVRDNVIHDVKYPGVIVYDTDGKEPNVIERNLIFNVADSGIQAASDAVVRNNVIFNCGGAGIYSRDHQSAVVGNLTITHNTVVNTGKTALRIIPPSKGKYSGSVIEANNALYGGTALRVPADGFVTFSGNVGQGSVSVSKLGLDEWRNTGRLNRDLTEALYPIGGSSLLRMANPRYSTKDDFDGRSRGSSRDVGAYRFEAKGPAWRITRGFKPIR